MVVHEENERPVEVAVIRKPLLETMSYVIVKNHVRELINTGENTPSQETNQYETQQDLTNTDTKRKKRKIDKRCVEISSTSFGSDTEIDTNDLQELKSVYMKCKEVMNRIERKYGHLLDLDSETEHHSNNKKRKTYSDVLEPECQCIIKKKIIFDDDGKQLTVDSVLENHICEKKAIYAPSMMQTQSKNIEVDYNNEADIILPDDLTELWKLLEDHKLETTYRNKVVEKIRLMKQEYVNEIRFNKHILMEKLKSNPDDVLDFRGANLSTIVGYT